MDLVAAIILGIVEGITEYLPISSTGHLLLVQRFMHLDGEAHNAYAIVIQGGAILAVLGLFHRRVATIIRGLAGRDPAGLRLAINLALAFAPAAILGPLLDAHLERWLFHPLPIVAALAVGGVAMLWIDRWQRSRFGEDRPHVQLMDLTWKAALFIGLLQCLAMWPGTSRSMITIVGGMLIGMKPRQAAEFSFLLGVPTLGGATLYKLWQSGPLVADLGATSVIVGIIVAFIAAALAIKWLVSYLNDHGLAIFGWYRLALAAVVAMGLFGGYLDMPNNVDRTDDGADIASALPASIRQVDQVPSLSVATHVLPSTTTGPATDA